MTLAITFLIATPFIVATCALIALDERYDLSARIAQTRLAQWVNTRIAQHIDSQ